MLLELGRFGGRLRAVVGQPERDQHVGHGDEQPDIEHPLQQTYLAYCEVDDQKDRPADPAELVLAEVWAVRYTLLNLFHAASQAASEGRQLSPDSVLKIRDQADARKLQQARKLLADSLALEGKEGWHMP